MLTRLSVLAAICVAATAGLVLAIYLYRRQRRRKDAVVFFENFLAIILDWQVALEVFRGRPDPRNLTAERTKELQCGIKFTRVALPRKRQYRKWSSLLSEDLMERFLDNVRSLGQLVEIHAEIAMRMGRCEAHSQPFTDELVAAFAASVEQLLKGIEESRESAMRALEAIRR